jgi:lysophospholipase L1-like esterase
VSRRVTILVLGLVAACGLATQAAPPLAPPPPKPNPDPARFTADIATFEAWDRQNSAPKDAILFVGSSSIRMWQTAESFPDLAVINRGFGGSHASDVNHFAGRIVLKYAPRIIVFYAGDNDIADGKTPEQVAADFEQFVAIVRAKLPDAKIIYLPIKPSLARWSLWPKMQETNALVKKFVVEQQHVEFVDTATPMLGSDGRPRPEIFLDDGLHMNELGYNLWSETLSKQFSN